MVHYTEGQLNDIYTQVLDHLKKILNFRDEEFKYWFGNSYLFDIDDDFASIVVTTKVHKTIITNFIEEIATVFEQIIGKKVGCHIFLQAEINQSIKISKNNLSDFDSKFFNTKLKEEYTFDNFVTGKSNRDAEAAARAVCYYPGQYNPLFIFGNSGLGKTHLLHAIGNFIHENNPELRVLYIYSEDLVTLLINAMTTKTVEELKDKILTYDFLLIDDIQRLKQSTSQEIFFNIYNKLMNENKQIVITSDIHPTELKGIENRLISRFNSGLSVPIGSPEFETAKAILRKKMEGRQNDNIMINEEVLDFLATRFSSDVRKLEGSLNELFFKAILYNPEVINLEFVTEIFKDDPQIKVESELTAAQIKQVVCEFYGLTKSQIESKSRTATIANPRHIAIYLCRKHLNMPFAKIGMEFGGRDHTTIMSSYEKMKKMLKEKDTFQQALHKIERKLGV